MPESSAAGTLKDTLGSYNNSTDNKDNEKEDNCREGNDYNGHG